MESTSTRFRRGAELLAATVTAAALASFTGCAFDPLGANLLPPEDGSAGSDADLADAAEPGPDVAFGELDASLDAAPLPDAALDPDGPSLPDAALPSDCHAGAQIAALTPGVSATGSTVGQASGTSGGGMCGGTQAGEDIYTFTLDERADVTVTTVLPGTSFDTVLYVRTDCTDLATTLGCESAGMLGDTVELVDVPPGAYFAIVDGRASASGSYEVRLSLRRIHGEGESCDPDGATSRCDVGLSCAAEPGDDGFVCVETALTCEGGAQAITLGAVGSTLQQGTTSGASGYAPACAPTGSGPEKLYRGVVGDGGVRDLVLEVTSASELNPVAEITADCGAVASSLACSIVSNGASSTELAIVNAVTPGDYYGVVDGWSGSSGAYAADFYLRPVVGAGVACDRQVRETRCGTGVCVDGIDFDATPTCSAGVPVQSESEDNGSCEAADGPRSADFVYAAQISDGSDVDVIALKPSLLTTRIVASVHGEGGTCPIDLALALTTGSCAAPALIAFSDDEGLGPCPYIDANVSVALGQTFHLTVTRAANFGAGSYTMVVDFIP